MLLRSIKKALPASSDIRTKMANRLSSLDSVTGLDEVKAAQHSVLTAETTFQVAQAKRRRRQEELHSINERLGSVAKEMDRTSKGDERHLELVLTEHELVKTQIQAAALVEAADIDERASFDTLSAFIRTSHERERVHAERIKWWSLCGSVIGALLGASASFYTSRYRVNEIRKIVLEGSRNGNSQDGLDDSKPGDDSQRLVNMRAEQDLNESGVKAPSKARLTNRPTSSDTAEVSIFRIEALATELAATLETAKGLIAESLPGADRPAQGVTPGSQPLLNQVALDSSTRDVSSTGRDSLTKGVLPVQGGSIVQSALAGSDQSCAESSVHDSNHIQYELRERPVAVGDAGGVVEKSSGFEFSVNDFTGFAAVCWLPAGIMLLHIICADPF